MDNDFITSHAREKMKGFCRVCKNCNGKLCAGEVPGMGGTGTGSAFGANIAALADVKLNLKTLHDVTKPETVTEIFGLELSAPILAAPMTGAAINMGQGLSEEDFILSILQGSLAAGTIGMTGDTGNPACFTAGLKAIKASNGRGIVFIKPRGQQAIKERIQLAEEAGALAVGVDVDGAGLITMALNNQPVGPKSPDDIAELVESTKLPFIVKGIMTSVEAELAVEAGAAAVVVSNHGGRVLDHTPGVAEVLPQVAASLKDRAVILADGGIRSGLDVLKMLALGAEAVLVGRPLAIAAFGGGSEGVKWQIEQYRQQLLQAMILTGCPAVNSAGEGLLYKR